MPLEQAMEELKKYADELTKIGDANTVIKQDKEALIAKFAKVTQYYHYILSKANESDAKDRATVYEAADIIADITDDNPSLEPWVNIILGLEEKKTNSNELAFLSNTITALTTEIKNMRNWDPQHVDEIKLKLEECQKLLISYQNEYDPNLYQNLMNDIELSLGKINRFNQMINSDTMTELTGKTMGFVKVWVLGLITAVVSIGIIALGIILTK